MLVTAAGAATAFGCSIPRVEVPAAVIEDKVLAATPASVQLKALTGELKPRNSSTDQTVRFFEGKIQFIDTRGQPIRSDEKQIKPTIKFQTYAAERLDPGQDAPRPWTGTSPPRP